LGESSAHWLLNPDHVGEVCLRKSVNAKRVETIILTYPIPGVVNSGWSGTVLP
jgi:hypothetical protein